MAEQIIGNEAAFRQRVIFLDMGVPMTDIDSYRDVNDKGFIFVEVKADGVSLWPTQRRAFTRLIKSCGLDKPSMLIIADHTHPYEEDINLATCEVRSVHVVVPQLRELEEWRAEDYCLGEFNVNDAYAAFHYVLGEPYNAVLPTDVPFFFNEDDSPFVALDSFQALY
jgi:hypothetical protein